MKCEYCKGTGKKYRSNFGGDRYPEICHICKGSGRILTPAERLIVAADFKPTALNGRKWVREQVLGLANALNGTGVYLKVNSALRACGYDLIDDIHERGLKVFADLKVFDIGETLSTDGILLKEFKPDILTTVCVAGVSAMQALKAELPDTEVLGVTVLTTLTDLDMEEMCGATVEESAKRFAQLADKANVDGLICAPADIEFIRPVLSRPMSFNTPNIRPGWAPVKGDDQNPKRQRTPEEAIRLGATRIVLGRPIVKAENPYDAAMRTIEEIASAI